MKPLCGICIIVFLLSVLNSQGQEENNSVLDKKITLRARSKTIGSVLEKISEQSRIFFSYDALLVEADSLTDISVSDKTIRETLDILFHSRFRYKVIENQVVIVKPEPEATGVKQSAWVFKGKVIDSDDKEILPYAAIFILGKNIGTVSNKDGEFILKIPPSGSHDTIVVSCLGYRQKIFPVNQLAEREYTIALEPVSVELKEVRVVVVNPEEIVDKILAKIPLNYSKEPLLMSSFYRETLRQDKRYIDVAEALLEIHKSGYGNVFAQDKIKVIKGRKSENVSPFQFVDFKMQGGPYYITKLDAVKTVETFLDPEYRMLYKYIMEGVIDVDNRPTYVIYFKPKEKNEQASYEGKLYVDMSSFALVRAEFSLSREGMKYAAQSLVRKKPKDFYVRPFDTSYEVNYRRINSKWYLSTARASVKFRVRSKLDRVNSVFDSDSDLLITYFEPDNGQRLKRDNAFTSKDIFADIVTRYDEGYWGDYNIIKPSEEMKKTFENYRMKSDSLFQSEATNPNQ